MGTLRELVDDLGPPILKLLTAPRGTDIEIDQVLVNDPVDLAAIGPGTIVLGINVALGREAAQLIATMARSDAPVLVLKSGDRDDETAAEAERAGVALLAIPAAAAWTQVILLIRTVLSRGRFGTTGEGLAGAGDLFAVANAIADIVDAPVTIEDAQSRVIAFSGRQEEADAARAATVLGRAVPQDWMQELRRRGVFQQVARARGPIYAQLPGIMLRAAIAVRAGDEILGSIWAALSEPLSAERERALTDAAGFVALHLLRHRLTSDAQGGIETELVTTLLEGGNLAVDAARRLNLGGEGFRVLAAGLRREPGDEVALQLAHCRDLLALELSSSAGRPVTALIGGTLYAVVPLSTRPDVALASLRARLESLVKRTSRFISTELLVGIGSHVSSIDRIPGSRAAADQALRVVRTPGSTRTIAEIGDVQAAAILLRFAEAHADDPVIRAGTLQHLHEHDVRHGTAYLATLRAYLDAFGDVDGAAGRLGVHPNTVRYRLRRLGDLVRIDLDNPTERLALMLQLHTVYSSD
jgi:DNA-binding PucR family transcriptional regulator